MVNFETGGQKKEKSYQEIVNEINSAADINKLKEIWQNENIKPDRANDSVFIALVAALNRLIPNLKNYKEFDGSVRWIIDSYSSRQMEPFMRDPMSRARSGLNESLESIFHRVRETKSGVEIQPVLERFSDFVENAKNLSDLRNGWQDFISDNESKASVKQLRKFVDLFKKKITELGLDMAAKDQRIEILQQLDTLANSLPEDNPAGAEIKNFHRSQFELSIFSILAGTKWTGEKMELIPIEDLKNSERPLDREDQQSSLRYTEPEKYEILDYHPKKAYRQVTDPESEFWGVGVYTDDFPLRQHWQGDGLNMNIYIPAAARLSLGSTNELNPGTKALPQTISVVDLQLGNTNKFHDTDSGFVRKFLEYLKDNPQ